MPSSASATHNQRWSPEDSASGTSRLRAVARFGGGCAGVAVALFGAGPAVTAVGVALAAVVMLTARRGEVRDSGVIVCVAAGGLIHSLTGLPWQVIPAIAVFLALAMDVLANLRIASRSAIRHTFNASASMIALTAGTTLLACTFMVFYLRGSGTFGIASVAIPLAVVAALFNAILEESIWRRYLLRLGAGCPTAPAVVGQAVSFGIVHWVTGVPSGWVGAAMATLYGSALGLIATKRGSFPLIVCSHWLVDMVIFIWLVH